MSLYYYISSPETFTGPLAPGVSEHPAIPGRIVQAADPSTGIYDAVLAGNVQCNISGAPVADLPLDDVSQYHDRIVVPSFEGVEGQASGLVRESVVCNVFSLSEVQDRKRFELNRFADEVKGDLPQRNDGTYYGGTVSDGDDVQTSDSFLAQVNGDFSSSQGKVPNNQALTYVDIRGGFYTRVKNTLDDLIGDISNHRRLAAENQQVHTNTINTAVDAQTLAEYDVTLGWPANPVL